MTKHLYGVLAAALIGLVPMGASAVPMVRFDIADLDIRVGETFMVDVVVDGVAPPYEVIAFGFDVDVSSPLSEAVAPMVGAGFLDDSSFFPNTDVAGSVGLGPGPSGDGILLATLSFVSSAAGLFDLGIVSDLLDPSEGLFTVNSFDPFDLPDPYDLTHSETVTVSGEINGAPEPETLALMGFGMAGIGLHRRRKRVH